MEVWFSPIIANHINLLERSNMDPNKKHRDLIDGHVLHGKADFEFHVGFQGCILWYSRIARPKSRCFT
jgi:hypothetical protein